MVCDGESDTTLVKTSHHSITSTGLRLSFTLGGSGAFPPGDQQVGYLTLTGPGELLTRPGLMVITAQG